MVYDLPFISEQIATNVISITDGQIYTNANLFKKGYRPAVDSALSVSRVGSSGQFIYFKRLVGTIKNDLTNYRQYVDSSQISDVESDDILLLKLKGIAIECIYQQDQLDGSPIEEIILLLLLYNKGFLNKLTYEQFNNRFLPQVRYLAATELLYVMYIGSVARNRMSKKLERLLSVMLLPIINTAAVITNYQVGFTMYFYYNQHGYHLYLQWTSPPTFPAI